LDQTVRELQVEVFPRHIPDHIELDVTELGLNDSLHVSDIVAENVEILNDQKATVCSVIPPRVEEVEEVEGEEDGTDSAEPEIIGKPKDEEGDESGS
jgi:large subunit ribosomal protein L25